jgi:hypothetical protein
MRVHHSSGDASLPRLRTATQRALPLLLRYANKLPIEARGAELVVPEGAGRSVGGDVWGGEDKTLKQHQSHLFVPKLRELEPLCSTSP